MTHAPTGCREIHALHSKRPLIPVIYHDGGSEHPARHAEDLNLHHFTLSLDPVLQPPPSRRAHSPRRRFLRTTLARTSVVLPLLIAPSDSSSAASLVVPPGPRHSQPQLALELTDHRGFGGLWDTFTAHTTSSLYHFWTSRSSHNPPLSSTSRRHSYSSPRPRSQRQSLILKLTCPVDFPVAVGCSYSRTLLSTRRGMMFS